MTAAHLIKRQDGRYYTEGNPFVLKPFHTWADSIDLKKEKILEPFAGANNIIRALQAQGYADLFTSFDIVPADSKVSKLDTIANFPKGFNVCVTNPPWLAKNSAHRRGLDYPETTYDDLYKHALSICLENCPNVAALIPATFLQSELFLDRLDSVIFLHDKGMFSDTENPVCLALFKKVSSNVQIFYDNTYAGTLNQLKSHLPQVKTEMELTFNDPKGKLGFVAFDNTQRPSIRFCEGKELEDYNIIHTSRMITRIGGDFGNVHDIIGYLNNQISNFREATHDVFLTPFKGLRKDGMYRRRMDYRLARDFITSYA